MDIRTKLVIALVCTSLVSITIFGSVMYLLSADLVVNKAGPEVLDELLGHLIDTGLSLGAFAILAGVIMGMLLSRRIRTLAETVDRVVNGELDLRAEVAGEDEVALLARSVNDFLNQLRRSGDIFQLGRLRVLVTENSAGNRMLLNELLTNWRMQAVMATNRDAAMKAIETGEQQGQPIQLIVLDMDMPDMEDLAFLQELVAHPAASQCPVILLAKDPERIERIRLKQLGVGHVLPTPLVASDLMEAILDEMGVSAAAIDNVPDVFLTQAEPRRILLVEDSLIIQKVTTGFLENWGHIVTIAPDGRAAVALAADQAFDLILMDLEMPEMGGVEATLAIRAAEPPGQSRVPIVALTAKATSADREQCMAAGMDDYVSKPVDPKRLYRTVASYPAGSAAPAPAAPSSAEPAYEREPASRPELADVSTARLVDWDTARNLTGGDSALLDDLVRLFPVESDGSLEAIAAGIAGRDAEAVTRAAHTLKSAARFFGDGPVVESAFEIEELGRAGGLDQAAERLPELRRQISSLITELAADRPVAGA